MRRVKTPEFASPRGYCCSANALGVRRASSQLCERFQVPDTAKMHSDSLYCRSIKSTCVSVCGAFSSEIDQDMCEASRRLNSRLQEDSGALRTPLECDEPLASFLSVFRYWAPPNCTQNLYIVEALSRPVRVCVELFLLKSIETCATRQNA